MFSDLLNATDDGKVSVLALLDLSAAFDTIDHDILLKRPDVSFGIRGVVLNWLRSYISDRKQTVSIDDKLSEPTILSFGVPQGSVLGPILFSLYAQQLQGLISKHDFQLHGYADDTQIYQCVEPCQLTLLISSLNKCVENVSFWMTANKLKLNERKTEVMIVGTKSKVGGVKLDKITLCGQDINLVDKVRNLGIVFDANVSMRNQVSNLIRTCYIELKRLYHIRKYLSCNVANKLACAFILSRLDYCNSLYSGLPSKELKKLQIIQNNAARFVMNLSRKEHITPVLQNLHWLPVKYRIDYKIASLTYQCLNDSLFPQYLKDMIQRYVPTRSLRSESRLWVSQPRCRLATFGARTLQYQSALIWNRLPPEVHHRDSLRRVQEVDEDLFISERILNNSFVLILFFLR